MKAFITGFVCCLALVISAAAGFYLWTMHSFKTCHFEYTQKIEAIENEMGGLGLVVKMFESGTADELEKLMALKAERDACREYYWQQ